MKKLKIDMDYVTEKLIRLLEIPSPTGYTDAAVRFVGEALEELGIEVEISRRGAIRAYLKGESGFQARSVLTHLDTIGVMVCRLKDNGRLAIVPIGTWSSRFAEGSRVTVITDAESFRGTILPLKASGHVYNEEVDTQKTSWEDIEIRLDERVSSKKDLEALGINVGDFVAVDPEPRIDNGFVNSRNLDDKAGVAAVLGAAKAVQDADIRLQDGCLLLFTISEEVGSGASTILHGNIAELVAIDNATPAPGQNSSEFGITMGMMDSTGPFDFHLTHSLLDLARDHKIPHRRDVFRYYRCDAASAVEAGNDIRTALVGFGLDASHGYERCHLDSIRSLGELISLYIQSPMVVKRDRAKLSSIKGFPTQPVTEF